MNWRTSSVLVNEATGRSLRPFQLRAIKAQLKRIDAVVHASTGMGKTTIVAGPHYYPASKGKVTIVVSPLIALHEEQVSQAVYAYMCCAYLETGPDNAK